MVETDPPEKNSWNAASVRIFSETLTREEIAERLGLEPEPPRKNVSPTLRQPWVMNSRLDRYTHTLEEHIRDVFERLDGRRDELRDLGTEVRRDLFLGFCGTDGQAGSVLTTKVVSEAASFGLSITLDVYVFSTDEA